MNIKERPSEETKRQWHQDPNNWIWGIFYYNKEDKRIFFPKKNDWMGCTINFANPMSVSTILILLLLIISLATYNK